MSFSKSGGTNKRAALVGLAGIRDLVQLYGGKITLGQPELGGLKARLALPELPNKRADADADQGCQLHRCQQWRYGG